MAIHSHGSKVIAEYVNGSLSREYVYLGGQLIATHEGGSVKYHHADHLSVRVTTDTSGAKIGEQGHYPFGENWYSSSTTTKFGFTSYERDGESLNDYAIFRFYVNRLGRFNSPDPVAGSIHNPQTLNRYGYVVNNPVNLIDPLGLTLTCAFYYWSMAGEHWVLNGAFCDWASPRVAGEGGGGGGQGGGGGLRRLLENIRREALKRIAGDCEKFIGELLTKLFDRKTAVERARGYEVDSALITERKRRSKASHFSSVLQRARFDTRPSSPRPGYLYAVSGLSTIEVHPGFFSSWTADRAGGLIHDTFHLEDAGGFSDSFIADTLELPYVKVPNDPQKTEENASAAWDRVLREKCGREAPRGSQE